MNKLSIPRDKERKRRGNSRFIFFFIVILIGLISLSWISLGQLKKADWLRIRKISVTGNENVSVATIIDLLHRFIGENLVEIKSKEVREQLLKNKRIEKINVIRLYPKTLKVKITERKGFLYVKSCEGDLFPIDEHGMVMEYAVYPSKEDLPIIHTKYQSRQLHVGSKLKDSFLKKVIDLQKQIIVERPDFIKSISEYYLENGQLFIVDTEYGTRILLDDEDLKDQLRRYEFVQENGDVNRKNIFDLRFKNQVIIRPEVQ